MTQWIKYCCCLLFLSYVGAAQENFRINPHSVDMLRAEALAARPPQEHGSFRRPDLVELVKLDSTIKLDIRYATSNNLLGTPIYRRASAFLQRPAARALVLANRELAHYGYGLLVYDAYRPWYITKVLWDATPSDKKIFFADPARGSIHNRGCAVDLGLYDLSTGKEVEMPSGYDEMTERAYSQYTGGSDAQRASRDLLRHAMEAERFTANAEEWWHFNYGEWRWYRILNTDFENLRGLSSRPSEVGATLKGH